MSWYVILSLYENAKNSNEMKWKGGPWAKRKRFW